MIVRFNNPAIASDSDRFLFLYSFFSTRRFNALSIDFKAVRLPTFKG